MPRPPQLQEAEEEPANGEEQFQEQFSDNEDDDIETEDDDFPGYRAPLSLFQQLGLVETPKDDKGPPEKIAHQAAMALISIPTQARRGRCVKKFHGSREFMVSLSFRLDQMPITRCNVLHFALAGDSDTHIPSVSVKPGRLAVAIISGKNFPQRCEPCCSCQITHKPTSHFSTPPSIDPHAPHWDSKTVLDHLDEGDELQFVAWHKSVGNGNPLGRASLSKFLLYPDGFEGPLELVQGHGQDIYTSKSKMPSIYVKVVVEVACRVVVRMKQGDRELEVHGPEGLPLHQNVSVDFQLRLASQDGSDDRPWFPRLSSPAAAAESNPNAAVNSPRQKGKASFPIFGGVGFGMKRQESSASVASVDSSGARVSMKRANTISRYTSAIGAHGEMTSLQEPEEPMSPSSPRRSRRGSKSSRSSGTPRETNSSGSSTSRSDEYGPPVTMPEPILNDGDPLGPLLGFEVLVEIAGKENRMPVQIRLPHPSKMWVYMGNPREPAPKCLIEKADYRWVSIDYKRISKIDMNEVSFDMPPREARMLARARELVEANQKWRAFDAIFGAVLLLNGISIGLNVELKNVHPDLISDTTWMFIDRIFLGIFMLELFLRLIILGPKWYLQIDRWMLFDTFVIFISLFTDLSEGMIELPFPVSVLRMLRLLKLAKMVRLVRAFKALGALVEAMMHSLGTLLWTVLLLGFVLFVGSVFTVNVVGWVFDGSEENVPEHVRDEIRPWFKVSKGMWKFLLMTTYDGWADVIRVFMFEVDGFEANVAAACITAIWSICAFGISNMVVGLMCHTAFTLAQHNTRMTNASVLNDKRIVLAKFRRLLKTYGQRPIFKSDRFITREELMDAVTKALTLKEETRLEEFENMDDEGEEEIADNVIKTMRSYIDTLQLDFGDFMSLGAIFGEDGEIEIDGLIEAIAIIQLQRYFIELNSMESMSFNKIPLSVRPVDVLFFSFSVQKMEDMLRLTERNLMGICAATLDCLELLDLTAEEHGILHCFDKEKLDISQVRRKLKAKEAESKVPDRILGIGPLVKFVNDYQKVAVLGSLTLPVDAVFGLFIMINGVFMAFQASDEDEKYKNLFYIMDLIFTSIFIVELAFRAMMYVSLEEDLYSHPNGREIKREDEADENVGGIGSAPIQSGEEYDMDKIKDYKASFRFFFVPPCPKRGTKEVFSLLPEFLAQPAILFDFIIVCVLAADLMVFEAMRRANIISIDPGILSVVRVFRLTRLAKLLRILKVFPQLRKLLFVIGSTGRLILWTVVIMSIFLYMTSIVMVLVCAGYKADTTIEVGGDRPYNEYEDFLSNLTNLSNLTSTNLTSTTNTPNISVSDVDLLTVEKEFLYTYFGQLLDASVSGWQLITLDGWDDIMDNTRAVIPLMCLFVGFMMVVGIMMMNMAVGVMCASSIGLVRRSQDEQQYEDLVRCLKGMSELSDLLEKDLGMRVVTSGMLAESCELEMKPGQFRPDARHEGRTMRDLSREVIKKATSQEFAKKLRTVFKKAKLVPVLCKHIFEAMDYESQGFMPLSHFIEGCLVMKEDLAKVDMFACASGLRLVRNKCVEGNQRLFHCHHKLEYLLDVTSTLVLRLDHDPGVEAPRDVNNFGHHLDRLSDSARQALQSLSNCRSSGTLPCTSNMGKWTCNIGTGHLREAEELGDAAETFFEGYLTRFKHEVEYGDIVVILIADKSSKKREVQEESRNKAPKKTCPVVVLGVVSDTLIKCKLGEGAPKVGDSWESFYVVKNQKEEESELKRGEDFWPRHVKVPKHHTNPTHSQKLFGWHIKSMISHERKLDFQDRMYKTMEKKLGSTGVNYHVAQAEKLVDFTLGHTPRFLQDCVHEAEYQEHQLLLQEYRDSLELLFGISDRGVVHRCWKSWWWCWYNNPNHKALRAVSEAGKQRRFGEKLKNQYAGMENPHSDTVVAPASKPSAAGEATRAPSAAGNSSVQEIQRSSSASEQATARTSARNYLRAKAARAPSSDDVKQSPRAALSFSRPSVSAAKPAEVVPVKWRQQPLAKARVMRANKVRDETAAETPGDSTGCKAGETDV